MSNADHFRANPQSLAYHQARSARYARIDRAVDLAMRLSDRGCTGDGCDEGSPCRRHRLIGAVVTRYQRMQGRVANG